MKRLNWAELKANNDVYITLLLSVLLAILGAFFEEFVNRIPFNAPISRLILIAIIALVLLLIIAFVRKSSEIAGGVLLVTGLIIGVRGFFYLYPEGFSLRKVSSDFYANVSTELISIAITVLIIDVINQQRSKQEELSDLKWQMSRKDNVLALEAVRRLRGKKWLIDGSLKGVDLSRANLSNAKLFRADLEGANFERTKLNNAFLKQANLRNANITIEQLATVGNLEGAIMPDGRKYEEWEPLIPVRQPIPLPIEQPEPINKKDSKFLLLLTGAGIAVFSSILSLWLHGKWVKQ